MSIDLLRRVGFHVGTRRDFVSRLQVAMHDACHSGNKTYKDLVVKLPTLISDERNLAAAYDHIKSVGGAAAGPDGLTPYDLATIEQWEFLRRIRDQLRAGDYQHGPVRSCRIPKRPGCLEKRTITVENLADRVVARATAQVLQPVLDSQAAQWSFCRPRRGAALAIACARHEILAHGRTTLIAEDLRDAFDHVARSRLLQICHSYIPNKEVCTLLEQLISRDKKRGIPQGSAVSPLLLNLLLDHLLQSPWVAAENPPLIRYLDDLLVPCLPSDNTIGLYETLDRLVTAAGMKLKYGFGNAVHDLRMEPIDWLGYRLRLVDQELHITPTRFLAENAVQAMANRNHWVQRFQELHEGPEGWRHASSVFRGAICYAAPTLPYVDPRPIFDLLTGAAEAASLDELPTYAQFVDWWTAAHTKWEDRAKSFLNDAD